MPKLIRRYAAIVVIVVSAVGCGAVEEASQGGGQEGDLAPVRLAIPHRALFTVGFPVYVAQEQGYYEDAGLEIETTVTSGGGSTVQSVISGSVDIAIETGALSVVGAYAEGAPIKIISDSTTGIDVIWYAKSDSPYETMQDLAGQKVGFSSPGSSTDLGINTMNDILRDEGLEEISGEAVGSPPDQFTAVQTDQIASGWTTPPFFLEEINNGDLKTVVEGSELEEYSDVAIRINFANADYVEQSPESVRAFLDAHQKAWDWIFDNREEAVQIWKEGGELEQDTETLLTSFDYYTPEQVELYPLSGQEKIVKDAIEYGFLEEELSEEQMQDLFDLQYAPGAE
ncbi:hypothetical protein GBA65_17400 [Rubrobacter marinus]|uniref:SsuA/THI5-like domain-containing protein n=1 Tax=Rubrobacter marinus TaxID=2653852 RepID=A0A6G8Q0M5_9ACTN|nr:ABC transporter substrate-binding protein [Rubrobacter marinus]QIN80005.1 hypothetical protein GBA65_17400 [Rubrobacter marinus]